MAMMSSPRKGHNQPFLSNKVCEPTNKFAPTCQSGEQMRCPKGKQTLNYKNFSQVQIGENSAIEKAYYLQLNQRKSVQHLLQYNNQLENEQEVNPPKNLEEQQVSPQIDKRPNFFDKQQSSRNIAQKTWKTFNYPQTEEKFDDQKSCISQNSGTRSQRSALKPRLLDNPRKSHEMLALEKVRAFLSPQPRCNDELTERSVQSPSIIQSPSKGYCFFSPQSDPFKQAFDLKNEKRTRSQERAARVYMQYQNLDGYSVEKKRMQNNERQDGLISTMKGNTLKQRHNIQEGRLDYQRKKVLAQFLTNKDKGKSDKEKCQQQMESNDFHYPNIPPRNQYHRQINKENFQHIQRQIEEKKKDFKRRSRGQYDKDSVDYVGQMTQQMVEMENRRQDYVKKELLQSQPLDHYYLQEKRSQNKQEKLQDRELIDQNYLQGQADQYFAQQKRKDETKACAEYCKQIFENKKNRHFKYHQPLANQKTLNESNFNLYNQVHVPKRDNFMNCASNASTISSGTLVSKSDISQQEFELRKKMVLQQKQRFAKLNKGKHIRGSKQDI